MFFAVMCFGFAILRSRIRHDPRDSENVVFLLSIVLRFAGGYFYFSSEPLLAASCLSVFAVVVVSYKQSSAMAVATTRSYLLSPSGAQPQGGCVTVR
jgi:hypothetical protein